MQDIMTIVATTTLVFTIQQFLTWAFNKLKGKRKTKGKER